MKSESKRGRGATNDLLVQNARSTRAIHCLSGVLVCTPQMPLSPRNQTLFLLSAVYGGVSDRNYSLSLLIFYCMLLRLW